MLIEEKMKIRVTDESNAPFTGNIFKIVIELCENDNNRPHTVIFISQDKKYIAQEGNFGCVSLWVDKVKSINLL